MILIIKKKNKIYRKYQKDIWGICFTDYRASEINKKFNNSCELLNSFLKFIKKIWKENEKNKDVIYIELISLILSIGKKNLIKDDLVLDLHDYTF